MRIGVRQRKEAVVVAYAGAGGTYGLMEGEEGMERKEQIRDVF